MKVSWPDVFSGVLILVIVGAFVWQLFMEASS